MDPRIENIIRGLEGLYNMPDRPEMVQGVPMRIDFDGLRNALDATIPPQRFQQQMDAIMKFIDTHIFDPAFLLATRKKDNSRSARIGKESNCVYVITNEDLFNPELSAARNREDLTEAINSIAYVGACDHSRPSTLINTGYEMLLGHHLNWRSSVSSPYHRQVITYFIGETCLESRPSSFLRLFFPTSLPAARFIKYCMLKHACQTATNIAPPAKMFANMRSVVKTSRRRVTLLNQICDDRITFFVAMHALRTYIADYNNRVVVDPESLFRQSKFCSHKWCDVFRVNPEDIRRDDRWPEHHGLRTFLPLDMIDKKWMPDLDQRTQMKLRSAVECAFHSAVLERKLGWPFRQHLQENVRNPTGFVQAFLIPCNNVSDYVRIVYAEIYRLEVAWFDGNRYTVPTIIQAGNALRSCFAHRVLNALQRLVWCPVNPDHCLLS